MKNTIDWELYDNTPYKYDKIKMLKAWAEAGDATAQCKLGTHYFFGINNFTESFRWHQLAAEQGDVGGMFYMGVYAYHDENYMEALHWYRLAAEQGDEFSQNNIGNMYRLGKGVPVDYSEAMRYFRMAAEKNYALAQFNIGIMYYWGYGVDVDHIESRKWFLLSAKQGHHEAQYSLGIMYGREGNDAESRYWHQLAAEQGNIYAISRYGQMLLCGYGGNEDEKKATSLLTEAASRGDSEAQLLLGVIYETGTCGKVRNIRLSRKWYKLAAKNGDKRAVKPLKQYRVTRHRRRDHHKRRTHR
jgi:TPR repeat protein